MLQVDTMPYASDALEDAMRLAQIKALNSFSFSDCINYLNYTWSDIYSRMACIDAGYYSKTMQITQELTHLPPYVKTSLLVYAAQRPTGYDRIVYKNSSISSPNEPCTYYISGNDLYCRDATRRTVWLEYLPACPQLFFTHNNRDPIIHDDYDVKRRNLYSGLYELIGVRADGVQVDVSNKYITEEDITACTKWVLKHRGTNEEDDISDYILREDTDGFTWDLVYISCDFPYIFVSYKHSISGEYLSGILDRDFIFTKYNPFDFIGRGSNVKYVDCTYNDKTGLGAVVVDYNDHERIKELGWTPDSKLQYPAPEMYRYLVARLADKFSALNESNIMGVQKELVEARYAFEAFLEKDKSAWKRIINVSGPNMSDWL